MHLENERNRITIIHINLHKFTNLSIRLIYKKVFMVINQQSEAP